MLRAVVDTNVLVEDLTLRGESGQVIEAWRATTFIPCVSTAVALEYEEVLLRRFQPTRHLEVQAALQALLDRSEYVPFYFKVRPMSLDPDDDFVLECALNAQATLVSRNDADLREPCSILKIDYQSPAEFLARLTPSE